MSYANKNILSKSLYPLIIISAVMSALAVYLLFLSSLSVNAAPAVCYGEGYPSNPASISCDYPEVSGTTADDKCYQLEDEHGRRWVEIPCPGSPTSGGIEGPTLEELQIPEIPDQTIDAEQNVKDNPIYTLLLDFLKFLTAGVALVVTTLVVVGGIQYMTAGGNPQNTQAAIMRISNALIGLAVYLFMFAILQWLIPGGLFG